MIWLGAGVPTSMSAAESWSSVTVSNPSFNMHQSSPPRYGKVEDKIYLASFLSFGPREKKALDSMIWLWIKAYFDQVSVLPITLFRHSMFIAM